MYVVHILSSNEREGCRELNVMSFFNFSGIQKVKGRGMEESMTLLLC